MTIIATAIGSTVLGAVATVGTGTGLLAAGTTAATLGTSIGAATGLSAGLATGLVGAATLGAGVGGIAGADAAEANKMKRADQQTSAANAVAAAAPAAATNLYSASTAPISSGGQQYFATGGLTSLAKGGVNLQDSDYIIPADVVSALGNGSSKAGARYLDQQFARLNSVGGVGALPESRKLMATREKKKTKRNA